MVVAETRSTFFEGNVRESSGARTLGLSEVPVRGVRIRCGSGLFEFHVADDMHLLVEIDKAIWTLDRSPGALADSAITGDPLTDTQEYPTRFSVQRATVTKSLRYMLQSTPSLWRVSVIAYDEGITLTGLLRGP